MIEINILKLGILLCNQTTLYPSQSKRCLLKSHNPLNWIYQKVFIESHNPSDLIYLKVPIVIS